MPHRESGNGSLTRTLLRKGKDLKIPGTCKCKLQQVVVSLLWVMFSVWFLPGKTQAYLMPSEQIVDLMLMNFSKFNTLAISQSTHLMTPEDLEIQMVLNEKIWLKSPDYFHSELTIQTNGWRWMEKYLVAERPSVDSPFRRLLLASDKTTILSLLSETGVNLESVAFTRYDGRIAYCLGDSDARASKLLVEKDRFLPMLFSYQRSGDPERKAVTVRFDDYRQVEGGWYPYEVTLYAGEDFEERCIVTDLEVNPPIGVSFFEDHKEHIRTHTESKRNHEAPEEERLKQIIELLKEKYRQTDSSTNGH
jgi:hypothetical protein